MKNDKCNRKLTLINVKLEWDKKFNKIAFLGQW